MAKNSKFGRMEQFLVHFGPFWRGQILVDLAGLQTPPLVRDTILPSGAPHQTPLWTATNLTQKSQRPPGHV